MTIRFPPERRQLPPHYRQGPRITGTVTTRETVRAIVHADAIRIAPPREPPLLSDATPMEPHAIVFTRKRPPPGTTAVQPATVQVQVRAVVRPDARIPLPARPFVERSSAAPVSPHAIVFAAPLPAPKYRKR